MKNIFLIALLFVGMLQSCDKKVSGTDSLTGKWRLVEVYNHTAVTEVPRPAGATGDFTVTFYNDSKFSSNTFNNSLEGSYTLTNNTELRFGPYGGTKVGEDSWGTSFRSMLIACLMQSRYPCSPSTAVKQNNQLVISAPFHNRLTFEKVN